MYRYFWHWRKSCPLDLLLQLRSMNINLIIPGIWLRVIAKLYSISYKFKNKTFIIIIKIIKFIFSYCKHNKVGLMNLLLNKYEKQRYTYLGN